MIVEQMIENLQLKDINPLICGYQACPPSHAYGPEIRSYYLMHYVHEGSGVLYNEAGAHPVSEGQIFLIRPGEVTTYIADATTPWFYSWIGFDTNDLIASALTGTVYDAPACDRLFREMQQAAEATIHEFYLCAKLYEVLATMELAEVAPRDERGSRYVRIARNYIESNYHRDVRIARIAENMGLDRSYLTHLFTEEMQRSPQQYLLNLRMNKAEALLRHSDQSIGEIASQVGYPDISAFSRMFKRHTGRSPSTVRDKTN